MSGPNRAWGQAGGQDFVPPSADAIPAADISDSTAAGRALIVAADAAAQRALLGVGSGGVDSVFGRTGVVVALAGDYSASDVGAAATAHTHAQADVTGLVAALAGKAATAHTHAQADVTNLVTDLAGKAATSHTHTASQVSDSTAAGRTILTAADAAAQRTALALVVGTDVQAFDAELAALAGLTSAVDSAPYFTGSGTAALATVTAFARTVLDDADAATARTTLGVAIGTNVQAYDAELAALAGLTSAADKVPYFTGSGAAALADLSSFARTFLDDTTAAAVRTTLGIPTPAVFNASTAAQGPGFATDTYLTGSNCLVPSTGVKIGTVYSCVFNVVKTGAGTQTPILNVRFGTNGSTADTSRGTLTWSAQTAVIDEGVYEIQVTFRVAGASAVIQTLGQLRHRLSITGFGTGVSEPEIATSGAFDSTVANSQIGLSINGGTLASWTVSLLQARLENLA